MKISTKKDIRTNTDKENIVIIRTEGIAEYSVSLNTSEVFK